MGLVSSKSTIRHSKKRVEYRGLGTWRCIIIPLTLVGVVIINQLCLG